MNLFKKNFIFFKIIFNNEKKIRHRYSVLKNFLIKINLTKRNESNLAIEPMITWIETIETYKKIE